ncbi:MAG: glycosyltransferase family 2 protein [Bacteroidales bacterium]|nr:glycosyltransferase family 2 protein [Bacteroidales bacterium]
MNISAIIITKNEERNIGRCLASLEGVADETIVVDSGSTDRTEELCRQHGALFVFHRWEGYSEQKNYANGLAHGDWILSIDADEALSPTLRESLLQLKREGARTDTVYRMNRLTNYCGRFVRHCGWYPDTKIRLWPTGTARWEGEVHEVLVFDNAPRFAILHGDLLHYSYYSIVEHAERQTHYAMLAAKKLHASGRRISTVGITLKTCWSFLRDYCFRLGFLDGFTGYTICRLNAQYTFMKYSRLRELNKSR